MQCCIVSVFMHYAVIMLAWLLQPRNVAPGVTARTAINNTTPHLATLYTVQHRAQQNTRRVGVTRRSVVSCCVHNTVTIGALGEERQ